MNLLIHFWGRNIFVYMGIMPPFSGKSKKVLVIVTREGKGALKKASLLCEIMKLYSNQIMQISAERKPDTGKQSLGKGQLERKSSKKGSKAGSLSRPVSFGCSEVHTVSIVH